MLDWLLGLLYETIVGLFLLSTLLITFFMCSSRSKVALLALLLVCPDGVGLAVNAPLTACVPYAAYIGVVAIMLIGV